MLSNKGKKEVVCCQDMRAITLDIFKKFYILMKINV